MLASTAPDFGSLHSADSLDDVLLAWSGLDGHHGACLLCDGETFPVRRRTGVTAVVCRSCGSSLEDAEPSVAAYAPPRHGEGAGLRLA